MMSVETSLNSSGVTSPVKDLMLEVEPQALHSKKYSMGSKLCIITEEDSNLTEEI